MYNTGSIDQMLVLLGNYALFHLSGHTTSQTSMYCSV